MVAAARGESGDGMTQAVLKPKVLVVDDERLIADTLATILKINGFETTALYSGEAALEWVESFQPNVVLSDIHMRKVNGIETAERIRRKHPDCRVILFTASALSATTRHRIQELGFEFLQRPLHPEVILACLQQ
jgi:DNA-binding NtrC family response regulator